MSVTLAGSPVSALTLTRPRVGAWVADVELAEGPAPSGAVVLAIEGRSWRGAVASGGVELGRWSGRVVGGAGGLAPVLGPGAFADCDLRTVLAETLREAGEALSADAGDLSAAVSRWARAAAPAAHAVADVARAAGFAWRVLPDGTVWVGPETWGRLQLGADLDVVESDPRAGRHQLAGASALDLAPGRVVSLDGADVRVGAVEHRLAGEALRTVVFEERGGNRLLAGLEAVVRRVTRDAGRHALTPATVVSQRGDGTLDLVADDPDVLLPRGVRYLALPGVTATVPAGTRVLVGFIGGDPARPYAGLWERGPVTALSVNGGGSRAAREGHATADGAVTAVTTPPAGTPPLTNLVLTYTAPGGAPQTITIAGLPPTVTVIGGWSLAGEIAEGSDALRLP